MWQATAVAPAELGARLAATGDDERPAFGLVLPGDEGYLLIGDPDAVAERMERERMSTAVRGLDLASCTPRSCGDRLGISAADLATGGRLAYTRSEADAIRAVASGEAKAAILVRPTRLEQLAAVAGAGDVMPQKSTYFYPKLLTGLVFYPLEGD